MLYRPASAAMGRKPLSVRPGVWGLAPTHGNYLRVYVRVYMCAHKALAWCKAFSALHIRKLSVGYVCASFRRFLLVLFFASLPAWARGGSG